MTTLQNITQINGVDYRWLGTTVHRPAHTGVLKLALFEPLAVHGKVKGVPKRTIKSGTPVTFDSATKTYKPYDGVTLDGFILTDVQVTEFDGSPTAVAPILDDGRVVTKYLPGFTKPTHANNNTTIVFM